MDMSQQAGALYTLLSEVNQAHPDAPVQTWLGLVSIPAGRGEQYRALAKSALQSADAKVRKQWLQGLFNSLLADDFVPEALELARENASELEAPSSPAPQPSLYASDVGVLFVHLGRLAKDDALIDEGFAISKSIPEQPMRGPKTPETARCQLLLELQRYAQAEQCIVGAMAKQLRAADNKQLFARSSEEDLPKLLSLLTRAYGATGRYADVITLLERAPWWGASELEDLTERQDVETTMAVARALHATGKTQAAVDLLQRRILLGTGDDRPYELLVQIAEPVKLMTWFDAIHAIDRFQERPLMWKAKVQLAQGKVEDAERTAKRALGVDPSDGEAQPGQRIHGYGVMSEILAARGASKDAEFFGNVVRAIRISERADEMRDLGLVKRALATYRQSEAIFSDAYCIHWRLADQLHGIGWLDEAKKHYRIAFQHMPHQFGRVASICMHCADVFGREYARGIAENVFSEIIASEPNNARGYHFLAQVRFEQKRTNEGIELLRKAVAIDPEYADAWKELLSKLDERADVRETESIRLRLFELDPLGIHVGWGLREAEIQDLARLWTIALTHKRLELPEPARHVALPAAAERVRAVKALANSTPSYQYRRDMPLPYALPAPGAVLQAQPALSLVSALIAADAPAQRGEAVSQAEID
jgi:tetratricopeptide (TPR) repeat protein